MDAHFERLNCKICYCKFDTEHRVPYVLNCGHTQCHYCTIEIVRQQKKIEMRCPACTRPTRLDFSLGSLGVAKNFTLIEFLEFLNKESLDTNGLVEFDPPPPMDDVPLATNQVPPELILLPFFQPMPIDDVAPVRIPTPVFEDGNMDIFEPQFLNVMEREEFPRLFQGMPIVELIERPPVHNGAFENVDDVAIDDVAPVRIRAPVFVENDGIIEVFLPPVENVIEREELPQLLPRMPIVEPPPVRNRVFDNAPDFLNFHHHQPMPMPMPNPHFPYVPQVGPMNPVHADHHQPRWPHHQEQRPNHQEQRPYLQEQQPHHQEQQPHHQEQQPHQYPHRHFFF